MSLVYSKNCGYRALFPCGDDMVCIIDDREDVWSHATNLIHVKPYHFFQHTGDINAPPGLDKHESDDKEGVDLNKLVNQCTDRKTSKKNTDIKNAKIDDLKSEIKSEKKESEEISEVSDILNENGSSKVEDVNIVKETPAEPDKNEDNQMDSEDQKDSKAIKKDETEESSTGEEVKDKVENDDKTSKVEESTKENEINGKLKAILPLETTKQTKEDNLIEIDDPDDYLVYLQDILKRIHKYYYELYDKMESGKIPDLKKVIPCKFECASQVCGDLIELFQT